MFVAPEVSLTSFACDGDNSDWSSDEALTDFTLLLVRRGSFRRRVEGVDALLGPLIAYVEWPGSVHQIAHPAGGDVCTGIGLSEASAGSLIDPGRLKRRWCIALTPRVDVAHRTLLKRTAEGAPADELAERALWLCADLLGDHPAAKPPSTQRQRRIAEAIREALEDDPNAPLSGLAARERVSMFQACRAFRAWVGCTMSEYRTRRRVQLLLDALEAGETNLAQLSAAAGFADQPHMTRAVRRRLDTTPGRLRTLLSRGSARRA